MPTPNEQVLSLPINPYSPPSTNAAPPRAPASAGSMPNTALVRHTHLNHEASIKAIGSLYFLTAFASMGMVIRDVAAAVMGATGATAEMLITLAIAVPMSGLHVVVGVGLRRMRKWVKAPVGAIAGLGLLNFPFGTLINAYVLYLVFSRKGAMVLSEEYAEVVRQTPHIKYKTSIVVWVLLGLVVFVVAGALISALV